MPANMGLKPSCKKLNRIEKGASGNGGTFFYAIKEAWLSNKKSITQHNYKLCAKRSMTETSIKTIVC